MQVMEYRVLNRPVCVLSSSCLSVLSIIFLDAAIAVWYSESGMLRKPCLPPSSYISVGGFKCTQLVV
jgi:hypothetical protein